MFVPPTFVKAPQEELLYMCRICICMDLWGVAVLMLDSNPDYNKGPRILRLSKDPSHRSLILATVHSRQPTL